jgi:DtxR family manganese transport transcriptional regulator
MMDLSQIAERHRRTRGDHASETAEDYVEAIDDICRSGANCRVTDLARHFGVTHVTVTKIKRRLQREGWVASTQTASISLSPQGKRLAARSRRRHQIVVRFLRTIGVSARTAEIDAEGIEHHVSSETLRMMKRAVAKNKQSRANSSSR